MKTILPALLATSILTAAAVQAQTTLDVAQYAEGGQLLRPGNLHEWIQTGASLGGEYNDEPFDPEHPGSIGVVQMEPEAYRYFMENGRYADGTMFLLSFYRAEGKSEPQLPGFVQGEMYLQEIHVIDAARFSEGRGFFAFRSREQQAADKLADGSDCVACHTEHGDFEGTFTQFYPALRERLGTAP